MPRCQAFATCGGHGAMRASDRSLGEAVTNRCATSAMASGPMLDKCPASRKVPPHDSPWLQCASRVQKHASAHCSSVRACANLPTGCTTT
eukprot:619941-Alexandrium_andersonii.AAC.1